MKETSTTYQILAWKLISLVVHIAMNCPCMDALLDIKRHLTKAMYVHMYAFKYEHKQLNFYDYPVLLVLLTQFLFKVYDLTTSVTSNTQGDIIACDLSGTQVYLIWLIDTRIIWSTKKCHTFLSFFSFCQTFQIFWNDEC